MVVRADAEEEAAVRHAVERGDGFGGRDRVVLGHEADARAEFERVRDRRGGRERDELVVRLLVVLRQLHPAMERRRATRGDVGLLPIEQRLVAVVLRPSFLHA